MSSDSGAFKKFPMTLKNVLTRDYDTTPGTKKGRMGHISVSRASQHNIKTNPRAGHPSRARSVPGQPSHWGPKEARSFLMTAILNWLSSACPAVYMTSVTRR